MRKVSHKKRCELKFKRLAALDAIGATKEKRKVSDTWINRPKENVQGLWNPDGKRLAGSSIKGGKL